MPRRKKISEPSRGKKAKAKAVEPGLYRLYLPAKDEPLPTEDEPIEIEDEEDEEDG